MMEISEDYRIGVQRLLDQGKRQGVITYDEINDALCQYDQLDADQLDDLLQPFAEEGIEVVALVGETAAIQAVEPSALSANPAVSAEKSEREFVPAEVVRADEDVAALEGMPLDAGRQKQLSDRVASQVRRLSVVQVLTLTLR